MTEAQIETLMTIAIGDPVNWPEPTQPSDWREEPATKKQIQYLIRRNLPDGT